MLRRPFLRLHSTPPLAVLHWTLLLLLPAVAASLTASFDLQQATLNAEVAELASLTHPLCALFCASLAPHPCPALRFNGNTCELLQHPIGQSANDSSSDIVSFRRRLGPCPRRWIFFNGRCYFQAGVPLGHDQSQTYCRGLLDDANLVSTKSDLELTFLIWQPARKPHLQRIGARKDGATWYNPDGTEFSTTIPTPGQSYHNCITLQTDLVRELRTYACTRDALPICAWDPPSGDQGCPSTDWLHTETHCYIYVSSSDTYDEARSNCGNLGGSLATISSENMLNILAKYLLQHSTGYVYIDLRKVAGQWVWQDGSSAEFTRWGGEFPTTDEDAVCAGLRITQMEMTNIECSTRRKSVCQRPRGLP